MTHERDLDRDRIAAQQLGLDDSWTIVYTANQIGFIYDCAEPCEYLNEDFLITASEVESAVEKAVRYIDMQKGWRLIGMRPKDKPEFDHAARKYGLVDFSALGAV
jgi:hypothetical protein